MEEKLVNILNQMAEYLNISTDEETAGSSVEKSGTAGNN